MVTGEWKREDVYKALKERDSEGKSQISKLQQQGRRSSHHGLRSSNGTKRRHWIEFI